MNATTVKPKVANPSGSGTITSNADKAKRPIVNEVSNPFWIGPSFAARDGVSELLASVIDLDLPCEDERCTDALRVVRLASDIVDFHMVDGETHKLPDPAIRIAGAMFDTIAMLTAALHYPGQTFGPVRTSMILAGIDVCRKVVSIHFEGDQGPDFVPDLLEALALVPEAIASAAQATDQDEIDAGWPEIDAERREIIRKAAGEVMDWSDLLLQKEGADESPFSRLMPKIHRRIERLGSVVLSGVSDALESTEHLAARLSGGAEVLQ
ncbi:hypothetical protein J7E62_09395 [Variovorax paradoxus]|nr:hypothetical protein [Variovorax paradoxus]